MTDVIIIGAGISGMTSALFASDGGLTVRLIDKNGFSSNSMKADTLSALPFFNALTPIKFIEDMAIEVERRGIAVTRGKVLSVSKDGEYFSVGCNNGTYNSYSVIIAAGKGHGISFSSCQHIAVDEECRSSLSGLMLCGEARRESGLLRCMADGIVCAETAKEWIRGLSPR